LEEELSNSIVSQPLYRWDASCQRADDYSVAAETKLVQNDKIRKPFNKSSRAALITM
jgi:hypothetical protein